MSKGKRTREASAAKKQARLEREAFEAKKNKVRKITAIITTALVLAVVLAVFVGSVASSIRLSRGEYLRREIAASSANIDVDGAVMNYFFNDTYNNFLNYYGSYVSYYGLDVSQPLKSQYISDTETWFDYMLEGAKENVTGILSINEAAAAEGVTLTEDEIEAIEERADDIKKGTFGKGVKTADIVNARKLETLAYKYRLMKETELAPSDTEIKSYFDENTKSYQFVDYLSYSIAYIDPDSETSTATLTKDEASALADKLAAATDADSFKTLASDAIKATSPDIPDEDLNNRLDSLSSEEVAYIAEDDFSEWAFDSAAVGQTHIVLDEDALTYTVYILTKAPYINEGETVTVRHILLTDTTYGSREKALKKAEALLNEWKADGADTTDFALLALEYSEDSGSYLTGGRYENIAVGDTVENFDAWCFDEARTAGDTGIVETDYGVHIMYFEGDGKLEWQASVAADIVSEGINALLEEWASEYTVAFDDTVLDMIPD